MVRLSQPVAGVGISDSGDKTAAADKQKDHVEHRSAPDRDEGMVVTRMDVLFRGW